MLFECLLYILYFLILFYYQCISKVLRHLKTFYLFLKTLLESFTNVLKILFSMHSDISMMSNEFTIFFKFKFKSSSGRIFCARND